MFQSVIEQQEWRARRLGTGAGVSVVVHAGIFAAVMVLSAGVAQEVEKEPPEVKMYVAAPRATPIPPSNPQPPQPPKPRPPKRDVLRAPTHIPDTTPDENPPTSETQDPPREELPYHPDGDPESEVDVLPCPTCIAVKDLVPTSMEPTGEEVVPFGSGMTRPQLVSGASIRYTREALAAGVTGTLIAKCVITREGTLENCRVIKGLPYMDEAVLDALKTRRYSPVMFQGRPTSVSYTFNITLALPR